VTYLLAYNTAKKVINDCRRKKEGVRGKGNGRFTYALQVSTARTVLGMFAERKIRHAYLETPSVERAGLGDKFVLHSLCIFLSKWNCCSSCEIEVLRVAIAFYNDAL
jgi:hypothetical protein